MWLCGTNFFISMVKDREDPTKLMVRARRKIDLVRAFGIENEIIETPKNDYRWRAFIKRSVIKDMINARIDGLDYTNFKKSVTDEDLHDMYNQFWMEHYGYGQRDPEVRKKRATNDRSDHFAWGDGDVVHHGDPKKK